MKVERPTIDIKPLRTYSQGPHERIMEVSSEVGGCLISVRVTTGGLLMVDVYRADDTVRVLAPKGLLA